MTRRIRLPDQSREEVLEALYRPKKPRPTGAYPGAGLSPEELYRSKSRPSLDYYDGCGDA